MTAAPILQVPLGARAVGMGGAYTGVAADVSALEYNPAGLSGLQSHEVSLTHVKGFADQTIENAAFGIPLPFAGVIGSGYSSLGLGLTLSRFGDIEVNRTRPDGSFLDTRTLNAGGDLVASFGYAERLAETPVETKKETYRVDHFIGIGGKWVRSTLAQNYSATASAADLGYLVRVPELGFSAGFSALNLGGRMRFIEEGDPLPMTFRGGVGYLLALDMLESPPSQSVLLAADGDYLYFEKQWHVDLGVEYSAMRNYFLRLGYQIHRDIAGLTVGGGARWRGFGVDYAWALTEAMGDLHRVSLSWRFGKVEVRTREEQRRPFIESMPEQEGLKELEEKTPEDIPAKPRRPSPEKRRPSSPGWIY